MRILCALALAVLPYQSAMSQVTPAGKAGAESPSVNRNRELERRAQLRQQEIANFLRPDARRKLETAARGVMERIRSGHVEDVDFPTLSRQEAQGKFGKVKPLQLDLLAFYILAETARGLATPVETDEAVRVDISVDKQQTARLQQMLDRESRLMTSLSNMLQRIADIDAAIVMNLK